MLTWRGYENRLKAAYEHVRSWFHMFFQTVSQVLMSVDNPVQTGR